VGNKKDSKNRKRFQNQMYKKEILKKLCRNIYIYERAYYNMFFYAEI